MKTIRMPKGLLNAWLDDLRSGKHRQGTGTLVKEIETGPLIGDKYELAYCCLGRLEIVADGKVENEEEILPTFEWMKAHGIQFYDRCEGKWEAPDEAIEDEAAERGFPVQTDYRKEDGTLCASLADINDSGYSFKEIADVIEANVEGV